MIRTAIVTGASSGIGQASAIALSKAGWNVVLTARRVEALKETAKDCPSPTTVVPGDIANEEFVKRLFALAVQQYGRLDLLFNNAGIPGPTAPLDNISLADFKRVLDVNITASFLCAREAFKLFKSQSPQGGRIINNGSIAARVPHPHSSPYAISKHAISGLTKSIALDGRPFGITCTQIDIGNALTGLSKCYAHGPGSLQANGTYLHEPMMDVDPVAKTVLHIANLPADVAMLQINIMAAAAPFVGRG